jgi:hypothetical protein
MKSQSKKMLLRCPHQGLNFWRACRGDNLKTSRNIIINGFDCSEAFPLPPNMPERSFSQYSTMKQFHLGSSIETVGLRLEKASDLQQNLTRLCFKILSSHYLESTVSQSGPNSTEVIKWATA